MFVNDVTKSNYFLFHITNFYILNVINNLYFLNIIGLKNIKHMSILIFFVVDFGRFSIRANDKAHERRLKGGEIFYKLYVTDSD